MNKWSVSPEELMRQEPRGGVVYKKYHALPFLPVYPIGESDSFENLVERNDTTHEIVCETLRWILDGGETSQNKGKKPKKKTSDDWWPGDWKCNRCGNHNFSYRDNCKRCRQERGSDENRSISANVPAPAPERSILKQPTALHHPPSPFFA